ncbi:uncharacterized protein [Cherax quadricarinatus]|uniref:uncharacterized protein isoform X1 n=1 Tax=Cherax quadricarinatus TaxID=27406 RepID=UPI00387E5DC0
MGGRCSRTHHIDDSNWVLGAPATQHTHQPSFKSAATSVTPHTCYQSHRVVPDDLTQVSVAHDHPHDGWPASTSHQHCVSGDTGSAPSLRASVLSRVTSLSSRMCQQLQPPRSTDALLSATSRRTGNPAVNEAEAASCCSSDEQCVWGRTSSVARVVTLSVDALTHTMPTTLGPPTPAPSQNPSTSPNSANTYGSISENLKLSDDMQINSVVKEKLWENKNDVKHMAGMCVCITASCKHNSCYESCTNDINNAAKRSESKCGHVVAECRNVSSSCVATSVDGGGQRTLVVTRAQTAQVGGRASQRISLPEDHKHWVGHKHDVGVNHDHNHNLGLASPLQLKRSFWWDQFLTHFLRTIQDPASQRLTWYKPPLSVLVIKKVRDAQVIQPFIQLVKWLTVEKRMLVFVEASVMEDSLVTSHSGFPILKDKLMSFREGQDDLTDKIDFIICLGGDGTLLYASSLFQQSVPPVMAFHLGSLGFLTPFKFDNFQDQVTHVLEGHAALTLRSRLRCIILRKDQETGKTGRPPTNLLVLNEVVIDRGPSPYLSNIDLYLDGKRITSVQGDGLIVSTPTGSTAYAVAAGASMIHPSVPAIMLTPICPHSLSFRPIVVPAGVELKIAVSRDSRNTAWVSFDGRKRQELFHGDSLRVTTSIYPVPSICAEDQIADWFASLDECLRWNDRKRQKHFDDPEDLSPTDLTSDLTHSSSSDTLDSLSERNEGCDN